jgi:hypothetical protein
MRVWERRLVYITAALIILAGGVWAAIGGRLFISAAQKSAHIFNIGPLAYYGADISVGGGMALATGVGSSPEGPSNGPWPQSARVYCFLAVVQALSNYQYWVQGTALPFPSQSNQGPLDGIPSHATSGAGGTIKQILYAMENYMLPPDGPVPAPTGFTQADISRDFGGDPRAQAYGVWYEAPASHFYHQYIYHTGVEAGTHGLAKGVASLHGDGYSPEIAIVNRAAHSVVIAGVWATTNPALVNDAYIDSFTVYNPWDESLGAYINGAYYARISYSEWTASSRWWGQPYSDNNGNDPDPAIGIYQAGPGTSNPTAHHWIGNYVSIQRDEDAIDSADYALDERGQVMEGP